MSMTQEEAIKVLKNGGIEVCGEADRISEFIAALDVALDALIPPTRESELEAENRELKERIVNWRKYMAPTREQVEKVWRGEWMAFDECSNEGVYCKRCKKKVYRIEYANEKMRSPFCPACGAAQTDEAVEMVMKRLEALNEDNGCS